MRPTLAVLVMLLGAAGSARAQAPVEIDDLQAPTSPAFALLDVAPASIERPENPKAFTMNLINSFSGDSGLPQNYALEVAPYWLTYHPSLTFSKYQSPGFRSALYTLALSVATSPLEDPTNSSAEAIGTRLGIGVRTNLVNGRFSPRLNTLVAELATIQERYLDAASAVAKGENSLAEAEKALAAVKAKGQPTREAEQALKSAQDEVVTLRDELRTQETALDTEGTMKALEIQGMDAQRLGLIVTLAAGKTWDFPSDDFSQRQSGRWGLWVTPAYRFRACATDSETCAAVIDAMAVVRVMREPGDSTSWDLGARLLWQPTREFRLSGEFLRRNPDEDASGVSASTRAAGMIEYKIRDGLSVYGSFGRDFEQLAGEQPLVSIMGLNIGLGRTPSVIPDKPQ